MLCIMRRLTRRLVLGCRSAPVSLEARSLSGWSTSRHCVVAKALDITPSIFQSIKSKAGALVIVLPKKMNELTMEEKQVNSHLIHLNLVILNILYRYRIELI